jgi:hypothetical protein
MFLQLYANYEVNKWVDIIRGSSKKSQQSSAAFFKLRQVSSVLEPQWFIAVPVPDQDNTWHNFSTTKTFYKVLAFKCLGQHCCFKKFWYFDFCIPFYVGSRIKSGSDSAKAKSCGSCDSGSGSTTLLVCMASLKNWTSCDWTASRGLAYFKAITD